MSLVPKNIFVVPMFCLLVSTFCLQCTSSEENVLRMPVEGPWEVDAVAGKGILVTYWGQYEQEGSLEKACATGNYNIIILSFLPQFGRGQKPKLDLAGHCDASGGGCKELSKEITSCQKGGIKIFLSLGGAEGSYGLNSEEDAKEVATYLWSNYLGGSSSSRPLGSAVLDGIDFDIEKGSKNYYSNLAHELHKLGAGGNKKVYLSAAPQCPYPDRWNGPGQGTALQTGLFDYVWVQFYNNEGCQYTPGQSLSSTVFTAWKKWTSDQFKVGKVVLGLPASLDAATDSVSTKTGYIPADVLIKNVLPELKKSPKYGGVMLWSYYYDLKHKGSSTVYSSAIKSSV